MGSSPPIATCMAIRNRWVSPLDVPTTVLIISLAVLVLHAAVTRVRWAGKHVRKRQRGRVALVLHAVAIASTLSMVTLRMQSEAGSATGSKRIDCAAIFRMPRLQVLGNGNTWSEVYLSQWGNSRVVLKTKRTHPRVAPPRRRLSVNSTAAAAAQTARCDAAAHLSNEAAIAYLFAGNPHVVQILGHCGVTATTVFEYYPFTLNQLLFDRRLCTAAEWNAKLVVGLCAGVAKGVAALHALDVAHGEINPGQFMVDAGGVVRIGDLHHSTQPDVGLVSDCDDMVGGRYIAPEQVRREVVASTAADVYALGLMIWTIANRKYAFKDEPKQRVWELLRDGYRLQIPETMDTQLAKIAQLCWQENPKDRPPAELVVHWLEGIDQRMDGGSLLPRKLP